MSTSTKSSKSTIDIKQSNFIFTALLTQHIPECIDLLTDIFCKFDPFYVYLNMDPNSMRPNIQEELEHAVKGGTSLVCFEKQTNKIVGVYCGNILKSLEEEILEFEEQTMKKFNKQIQYNPSIGKYKVQIPKEVKTLEFDVKYQFLKNIDIFLIHKQYYNHKLNNELENTILCDYYCVSNEYMGTKLAPLLAWEFFQYVKSKGIKNVYGTFFNPKAVRVITGSLNPEFPVALDVEFTSSSNGNSSIEKDEKSDKFSVYLLFGGTDNEKVKPKF